jgi:hypothetical protein
MGALYFWSECSRDFLSTLMGVLYFWNECSRDFPDSVEKLEQCPTLASDSRWIMIRWSTGRGLWCVWTIKRPTGCHFSTKSSQSRTPCYIFPVTPSPWPSGTVLDCTVQRPKTEGRGEGSRSCIAKPSTLPSPPRHPEPEAKGLVLAYQSHLCTSEPPPPAKTPTTKARK